MQRCEFFYKKQPGGVTLAVLCPAVAVASLVCCAIPNLEEASPACCLKNLWIYLKYCFRSWLVSRSCAQPHLGVGEQGEEPGHQVAGPLHGGVAEGLLDV